MLIQVLTAAGIERRVFVGTSRGGLITMALCALRPDLIAGVVLNDIGPVIEPQGPRAHQGLCRQAADAARFRGGARRSCSDLRRQFPRYHAMRSGEGWRGGPGARTTDNSSCDYDPILMKTLETLDLERPAAGSLALFRRP